MSGRLIPSLSVELMAKIAERVAPGAIDRLLALWGRSGPMTPNIHLDVPTLLHQFHAHEVAALEKVHAAYMRLIHDPWNKGTTFDKVLAELLDDTKPEDPT